MKKFLLTSVSLLSIGAAWFAAALPVATVATHGLNPAVWPSGTVDLIKWFECFRAGQLLAVLEPYLEMAAGQSLAFPDGGQWHLALILVGYIFAVSPVLHRTRSDKSRDPSGRFGNARWASPSEIRELAKGVEVGVDPETGRPVRVSIEGNLLTVAPQRTGKTSAFIIPNLLTVGELAWDGMAVVIDPKGDVYRATSRRRHAMGHKIVKFDLRHGQKTARWNPLASLSVQDVAHIQRIAEALVTASGEENAFFTERGSVMFAGAVVAALIEAKRFGRAATPADVARLLNDPDTTLAVARRHPSNEVLASLAHDLSLDPRSRDPLISTAKTAVAWLLDQRFRDITSHADFTMAEIARGGADLFIIVPPESAKLLAPLIRWMLLELFAAVGDEGGQPSERILVLVDEADALGRFDELIAAHTLLPSRGLSLWTFWQSIAQIRNRYGEAGAATLTGTAEFVTISDIGRLGDDAEAVSRALDDFTAFTESTTTQRTAAGQTTSSTNKSSQAIRLMTTDALKTMPADQLIVLPNSKLAARRPMRLRKTKYWADQRFAGLYDDVAPVKRL